MKMLLNNQTIDVQPERCTLSRLLSDNYRSLQGMAVAVNNKLVGRDKWDVMLLNEGDDVVVITAAFGG